MITDKGPCKIARAFCLLFLFIFALFSIGLCQAQKFYEDGIRFLQEKDYKNAILNLEFAFGQEPQNEAIRKGLTAAYQYYASQFWEKNELKEAIKYQKLALSLDPQNKTIEKNLAIILTKDAFSKYKDADAQGAIDELFESLRHNADNPSTYSALGQIYYDRNEFEEALNYWKTSVSLDPTQKGLQGKIKKVAVEADVEREFKIYKTENFIVSFDDEKERELGFDIMAILSEAYRDVGWRFDHYPKRQISVVIYTRKQFRDVTEQKDWVLGIYEGRIRLPLADLELDPVLRKQIVFHEYTHALLADLYQTKIPIWLHEAMAQSQEPDWRLGQAQSAILKYSLATNSLIPIGDLETYLSEPSLSREFVLANLEARLFADYLVYRYSYYILKELLNEVSLGKDFAKAAQDTLYLPLERLWENFTQYLKEKYL